MTDLPRAIVAIPLADAAICASCEAIFWLPGSNRCPSCADEHFLMVQNIVGTIKSESTPDAVNVEARNG